MIGSGFKNVGLVVDGQLVFPGVSCAYEVETHVQGLLSTVKRYTTDNGDGTYSGILWEKTFAYSDGKLVSVTEKLYDQPDGEVISVVKRSFYTNSVGSHVTKTEVL